MKYFLKFIKLLPFLLLLLLSNRGMCAIKTFSLANGSWEDAGNWSSGIAPGCGDTLIIPPGRDAKVTVQNDYTGCTTPMVTFVYGTLSFVTGKKLLLPCGSYVLVKTGGTIDPGNGGGSSNLIDICGVTEWKAGDGLLSGPTCLPLTGNCSALLPVSMLTFTAEWYKNQYVDVRWITQSEVNNDYFEIYRSQTGLNYELIGTVPGHGNSTSINYYSFPDDGAAAVKSNLIYYRLRQVDFDGNYAFYGPVVVKSQKANSKFVVVSNLLPKHTPLQLLMSNEGESKIIIVDGCGRMVLSRDIFVDNTSAPVSVELPDMAAGLYTIICHSDYSSDQQKLVIAE